MGHKRTFRSAIARSALPPSGHCPTQGKVPVGLRSLRDKDPLSRQWRYDRTLNTASCSRACSITFSPKSWFGPTSVTGA